MVLHVRFLIKESLYQQYFCKFSILGLTSVLIIKRVTWFNEKIKIIRDRINFLRDLNNKYPSPELAVQMKKVRCNCRQQINRSKKETNSNYINSFHNHIRAAWQLLNGQRKTKKRNSTPLNIWSFLNCLSDMACCRVPCWDRCCSLSMLLLPCMH